MPKSILCADASAAARRIVRNLIISRFGACINYEEATRGPEAVVKATSSRPDVAIIDIALPGLNGFETARYIGESCPNTAVLALSGYELDAIIPYAYKGIRGFVFKASLESDLIPAIESLLRGKAYFPTETFNGAIAAPEIRQVAATGGK